MLAFLQSSGRVPVSSDSWNINDIEGARCVAHCFSTLFGILSGPDALDGFIFCSSFSTPLVVIVISWIEILTFVLISGSVVDVPFVKTDANWSSRIWAFSLLSFASCPCFLRGATPILSCFRHFSYFQKGFELFLLIPSNIE